MRDHDSARAEITVAIPTHNRRETVLLALESARRQTRPPDRILVLADGCTDGTQDAVRAVEDPSVELLDLPKGSGLGHGNRNEALRGNAGVVSWLADDDLYLPDHLERVGELHDSGDFDLVQGMACIVDEDSSLRPAGMDWRVAYYRRLILKGVNRTPASAVSHRADRALAVGGWREDLRRSGDMDLWQRLLEAGVSTAMVSAPTVLHFRATGRDQPYAERVEQNSSFLARMADPRGLAELRAEMTLALERAAARKEAWLGRLMLGLPHLRTRFRLRDRSRDLRRDRRSSSD